MDQFKNYSLLGLLLIVVTSMWVIIYQHDKIDNLSNDMAAMKAGFSSQIEALKTQSQLSAKQVIAAHTQADQALSAANKNSAAIMSQKVSSNCDAAVAWALQQVKSKK